MALKGEVGTFAAEGGSTPTGRLKTGEPEIQWPRHEQGKPRIPSRPFLVAHDLSGVERRLLALAGVEEMTLEQAKEIQQRFNEAYPKVREWLEQERQRASQESKVMLQHACKYLRDTQGRTVTELPRRILTAAMKCVGTDRVVDMKARNIQGKNRTRAEGRELMANTETITCDYAGCGAAEGKAVLPMDPSCDNFDFQKGCRGHEESAQKENGNG